MLNKAEYHSFLYLQCYPTIAFFDPVLQGAPGIPQPHPAMAPQPHVNPLSPCRPLLPKDKQETRRGRVLVTERERARELLRERSERGRESLRVVACLLGDNYTVREELFSSISHVLKTSMTCAVMQANFGSCYCPRQAVSWPFICCGTRDAGESVCLVRSEL